MSPILEKELYIIALSCFIIKNQNKNKEQKCYFIVIGKQ